MIIGCMSFFDSYLTVTKIYYLYMVKIILSNLVFCAAFLLIITL